MKPVFVSIARRGFKMCELYGMLLSCCSQLELNIFRNFPLTALYIMHSKSVARRDTVARPRV